MIETRTHDLERLYALLGELENKLGGARMLSQCDCRTDALRDVVRGVQQIPKPRRRSNVRGLHLFCTRHGKPYIVSGFSSIWQRKMRSALEAGVLKDRFTDHDIRRKAASDTSLEHAG